MSPSIITGSLRGTAIAVLLATNAAAQAAPQADAAQVIQEACGDDPEPGCIAELRKVCHRKMTMRCYLSRKDRIDAKRDAPDSPEREDERDDRSIFYDE